MGRLGGGTLGRAKSLRESTPMLKGTRKMKLELITSKNIRSGGCAKVQRARRPWAVPTAAARRQ
jgi:hypothetical protein